MRGEAKPKSRKNAHHVFVDRYSGFNIFTFASLRRARYFSPQAQWFMQFSVALVCHFSLLLCISAANNNGEARHGENAHFGSGRTFVDRRNGINIFCALRFFAHAFLSTGTTVSTLLRLLRCVARATFLHRHNGLCNFLSRSFVTVRHCCAPAQLTIMATRTALKTHALAVGKSYIHTSEAGCSQLSSPQWQRQQQASGGAQCTRAACSNCAVVFADPVAFSNSV